MTRKIAKSLICGTALALCATSPAWAQSTAVDALLNQARYWQERGQQSRANEAYRRVLDVDPDNAEAKRALNRRQESPTPTPVRAAKPASLASPSRRAPSTAPTPVPYRPSASERAGQDRAAGFDALGKSDLSGAKRRFDSALALIPNDADALGGLGIVALRRGEFANARDLLTRASRGGNVARWSDALASASFYAESAEARRLLANGQAGQAASIAERLVASGQGDEAVAYGLLADIYETQGRYAEAARASRQALAVPGAAAELSDQLETNAARQEALAAWTAGDSTTAERLFQRAMLTYTQDPWIRYEFGRFLLSQNRRSEANALMQSLTGFTDPDHLFAAALLAERLDKPDMARQLVERIPEAERSAEMQGFALGVAAQRAIERAVSLADGGQALQASAGLRQIGANTGLPPERRAEIAGALYDIGDLQGASSLASELMTSPLNAAEAYEPLVRILAGTGQPSAAQAAIRQASSLATGSPADAAIMRRMNGFLVTEQADRLREEGRYAEAFDVLQAGWSSAPGNNAILVSLGQLYQAGAMEQQATQTYRLVLQSDGENMAALMGLIDTASTAGDFESARAALRQAERLAPDDYNVYLAGARFHAARGANGDQLRYLERARELYMAQHGISGGAFGHGNPFATMQTTNPFATQRSVNPFDPASLSAAGKVAAPVQFGSPPTPIIQEPSPEAFSNYAGTPFNTIRPSSPNMSLPMSAATPRSNAFGKTGTTLSSQSIGSDPVLASIAAEIDTLRRENGTMVEVDTHYRERSGEKGLSQLAELGLDAAISTGFAGGRIAARAKAISIDAGTPEYNSLLGFGRNGLLQARGIIAEEEAELINAGPQHASGVAVSVKYKSDIVEVDVGSTPLGFDHVEVQGGVAVTPSLSPYSSGRLWFERRPVTDSVLSYAGTYDPVTGAEWGSVMRTGGGASFAQERNGSGFYADVSYFEMDGHNVRNNNRLQVNAGGYLQAMGTANSVLTVGINGNYQAYANNQNNFTFGHGGYFSPQHFLSVSLPVRYRYEKNALEVTGHLSPGYQSYEQDAEPFYPTDPAAQGELDALSMLNSDVTAYHDASSETGFGINLGGSFWYDLNGQTRIGGELDLNTFGEYNEVKTVFGLKQSLGAK
ncbi:MAG: cellulose synthase [Croceicoccus sp.]|nr:cellulose synthase [Croceicoccus sp.]MAL26642.1 cellulose synthase [Croceicoccus sp.]|tara:strand:- start:2007 stop:5384 length:3378 start_codon:yes stop_codon:yes gene_type:complete